MINCSEFLGIDMGRGQAWTILGLVDVKQITMAKGSAGIVTNICVHTESIDWRPNMSPFVPLLSNPQFYVSGKRPMEWRNLTLAGTQWCSAKRFLHWWSHYGDDVTYTTELWAGAGTSAIEMIKMWSLPIFIVWNMAIGLVCYDDIQLGNGIHNLVR